MQWFKTEEILPKNDDSIDNRGWVLGRFSRTSFSTVRYVESHTRWQYWDYSWCERSPREWMYIPDELVTEWDMIYGKEHDHAAKLWEEFKALSKPDRIRKIMEMRNNDPI